MAKTVVEETTAVEIKINLVKTIHGSQNNIDILKREFCVKCWYKKSIELGS